MDVEAQHVFWAAYVVACVASAWTWWRDVQETMRRRPELASGELGRGAEMLERHPGVFMIPRTSARFIRLFWLIVVGFNVIAFALWFSGVVGNSPGHPHEADLPWVPVVFPFFFVGLWVGIGFALAAVGGWQTIAAHYPLVGDAPPPVKRFAAAEFGLGATTVASG